MRIRPWPQSAPVPNGSGRKELHGCAIDGIPCLRVNEEWCHGKMAAGRRVGNE